jgi:hypothetical protein
VYSRGQKIEKQRVHPQFRANFDSRFFSREAAKNAKKKFLWLSAHSLEKVSSVTEFRHLRVFCGFA